MSDEEVQTERVVMVWPKELKAAVREVAGPRGMTEWVVATVRKALTNVINETVTEHVPAETAPSENEQASEPVLVTPAERESPPTEAPTLKTLKQSRTPITSPDELTPTLDLPHDIHNRDDLFARLLARTNGNMDDIELLKKSVKPASQIPKPEPKADMCPICGEELVNGECWTCAS